MKKIYYTLISLFLLISCTSDLEKNPSDSLPEDGAIQTVNDLSMAVNGVYSAMISQYSFCGDYGLYADGRGGDTKLIDNSSNHFQPVVIFQLTANSGHSEGFFREIYRPISRINRILNVVENITDKANNVDTYNDLTGQLYALRGLLHFEAAKTFAQLPTVADDLNAPNSGVILSKEAYPYNHDFSRATLAETYSFIISDFQKALTLLSKDRADASGKINYWAAEALLSRVYLYNADYNNALSTANDVINSGKYTLYKIDDFLGAWTKTGTSESLFEVITTDLVNAQRYSLGYYTNPDGYAECAAADDFVTWLLAQTGDIRSQSIKQKQTSAGKNKGYYTIKYQGQEGASTPLYTNNPKVIRLADVYLIAAEAALKGGTATNAKAAEWYYNELRKNRIENYTDAASVSLENILDERRREFFCENQRMFDLVRNKLNLITPKFPSGIAYNDYRVIVAFPQREIDISPSLKQNPGYN